MKIIIGYIIMVWLKGYFGLTKKKKGPIFFAKAFLLYTYI